MRALVTGGAGFIGSHLAEALCQAHHQVRVVDNLSTGRPSNLAAIRNQAEFIAGDLLDEAIRDKATRDIEVVFHLAAIPSVPRSIQNPLESHANGAQLTLLLLDSARRNRVGRFILASSSSIYGNAASLPTSEETAPDPLSPYAATKLACECYAQTFARCYELDTAVLRYFNIFGPRQDPHSPYSGVIARFCQAFCANLPLTVFGDGEQSRDFTYVSNAVQANLLAAAAPGRLNGACFNIGCGQRHSLNTMLRLLNGFTGLDRCAEYQPARPGEVRNSCADIRKARQALKYEPAIPFAEGLQRTLAWYQQSARQVK